jgi:hypothetical protein
MASQAWGVAVLRLVGVREQSQKADGSPQLAYDCWLEFLQPDGSVTTLTLAKDTALLFDPFQAAIALFGGLGWELVTVQHGLVAEVGITAAQELIAGKVRGGDNGVAYFKREAHGGVPWSEFEEKWPASLRQRLNPTTVGLH